MTPQEHLPADDCQNTKIGTCMDRHPGPENSKNRQKSEAKRPHCKSAGFAYASSNPALPTTFSQMRAQLPPPPATLLSPTTVAFNPRTIPTSISLTGQSFRSQPKSLPHPSLKAPQNPSASQTTQPPKPQTRPRSAPQRPLPSQQSAIAAPAIASVAASFRDQKYQAARTTNCATHADPGP
jgi:hypothetical protein